MTMRLHVMSDLHLECASFEVPETDSDIVILAGDIGIGIEGVLWAQRVFDKPVIYVSGNHEYHDAMLTMNEHRQMMKQAADGSNVMVLDSNVTALNNIRFIGTTLWSDLKRFNEVLYCDSDNINAGLDGELEYEAFHSDYAQSLFDEHYGWLKAELAKPFGGKTVVITHHAPSLQSIHPEYVGNLWNPCFASDIEELMAGVDIWIHGHTHSSLDYELNGTRVICNPRGYSSSDDYENMAFNASMVIEV